MVVMEYPSGDASDRIGYLAALNFDALLAIFAGLLYAAFPLLLFLTTFFIQAAVFIDSFAAGLLLAHDILYCSVSYALLTGPEDMRSIGNASLPVAIISAIYMVLFYTGANDAAGNVLIGKSNYLAFACLGYVVLTLEVWGAFYGKLSGSIVAYSLMIWVVAGLWVPAFSLMGTGTLPF
jgi:putative amide transporter protein